MKLGVNIGKLKLKNPVIVSSGTFGCGEEFKEFFDIKKLGAITTKTITLRPSPGNPPPRLVEIPFGLLNSIGLQNDGYEQFKKEKLPYLKRLKVPVIISIAGKTKEEFVELAKRLEKTSADAVELNISCPNIRNSKLISQDSKLTYEVVRAVRKASKKTLITKLSPNVTDIVEIAKAAKKAGSDAISSVNTFYAMTIDINNRRPQLASIIGGLSGPAIKPLALAMVYKVAQNLKIPIIGMGGIMNAEDAVEFIIAGATAVGIGSANFINPKVSLEVLDGIKKYLRENNIKDIKKLIGSIKT